MQLNAIASTQKYMMPYKKEVLSWTSNLAHFSGKKEFRGLNPDNFTLNYYYIILVVNYKVMSSGVGSSYGLHGLKWKVSPEL